MIKLVAEDGYVFDWINATDRHLYALVVYVGLNDSVDNYEEVLRYVTITAAQGKVLVLREEYEMNPEGCTTYHSVDLDLAKQTEEDYMEIDDKEE